MVTSDMQRAADLLYHRIVVYLIIVFSLRPFTCKDLLLTVLRKMQTSIFLLLVIVMDSIKSNLSVNFVEGIQ